jgi:hypothetical protein
MSSAKTYKEIYNSKVYNLKINFKRGFENEKKKMKNGDN